MNNIEGQENIKKKKIRIWIINIAILALVVFGVVLYVAGENAQKRADEVMREIMYSLGYTVGEELLSQEEIDDLCKNYTDSSKMTAFKESQQVRINRLSKNMDFQVADVILTRHEDSDGVFFQLCFVCEFDDNVSECLYYCYRYYENGNQMKYIVYSYETPKIRFGYVQPTGLTVKYNMDGHFDMFYWTTMYDQSLREALDPDADRL